jgi:hypothetical protein
MNKNVAGQPVVRSGNIRVMADAPLVRITNKSNKIVDYVNPADIDFILEEPDQSPPYTNTQIILKGGLPRRVNGGQTSDEVSSQLPSARK